MPPIESQQFREVGFCLVLVKSIHHCHTWADKICSDIAHAYIFRSVPKSKCAGACGDLCESSPYEFEKFIASVHHSSINEESSQVQDDSSQFLKLPKKLRHIGIFPPYFLLRIPFESSCSQEFFFLQSLTSSYDTGASIISLHIPVAHSVYVGELNLIRLQGF